MVRYLSGCRSNTHTTHTIRLSTEKTLVALNGTPSNLLKHTPIWNKIEQRYLKYRYLKYLDQKSYCDF